LAFSSSSFSFHTYIVYIYIYIYICMRCRCVYGYLRWRKEDTERDIATTKKLKLLKKIYDHMYVNIHMIWNVCSRKKMENVWANRYLYLIVAMTDAHSLDLSLFLFLFFSNVCVSHTLLIFFIIYTLFK